MASEQNRFLQQQQQQPASSRRKRWRGCLTSLSCFGLQKGGKRVVPSSRITETHSTANQPNGSQTTGLTNQTNSIHPSLLAPPSSPASFSNSALQSTIQSPNCFLSPNSPEPSSIFATGPYANETQLVSPPVFSTFTTEPSTAPLTPPPELAHLTTPSSPDVPYAHYLSSNFKNKRNYTNDLHATYSLYPGTLRSPISRENGSDSDSKLPQQDANFFCPETFAQFYLDQSSFPHSGGRLSVSKESDVYFNGGNGVQSKVCKQDFEELEAYRASFGFSADEIVSTAHYVEISDVMDHSFSMMPSGPTTDVNLGLTKKKETRHLNKSDPSSCDVIKDQREPVEHCLTDDEDVFSKTRGSKMNGKYYTGTRQSNSDAEIEYRRGRSLRESRGNFKWP